MPLAPLIAFLVAALLSVAGVTYVFRMAELARAGRLKCQRRARVAKRRASH